MRGFAAAMAALIVAATAATSAAARPDDLVASVVRPPDVQRLGRSYTVVVNVRNTGGRIRNFCLDFGTAGHAWSVRMSGVRAYADDVFCVAVLRAGDRRFVARITPEKAGQRTLPLALGRAAITPGSDEADVIASDALAWASEFVLTA